MDLAAAAPRTREGFLDSPLRELISYWLDLRCDPARCTKVVCTPLRMLVAKCGGRLRLEAVVARLRCTQCGERPARVSVTDSPIGSGGGHHIADCAKWSVSIRP